ncbi:hypothetical protein ACROYT_G030060 [Oculina patagonica]
MLIFTPDPSKPASLRTEVYCLSLFANSPSRGFMLIFTRGPKESDRNVLHEPLKMTILGPCAEMPPRRLKLIFTANQAKPASFRFVKFRKGIETQERKRLSPT